MDRVFHYLIVIWLIIINLVICGKPNDDLPICTICLQVLIGEYSLDAWENPFHSHHANEGIFCHSCSRIISQGITQGGVRYTDGRHLCSLCQASVVESDSTIYSAYTSIIEQFIAVGIHNIPHNIPIELINLIELNSKCGQSHVDLKGFTHTAHNYKTQPNYTAGRHLLANIAQVVCNTINAEPKFGAQALKIMNQSSIVQIYTKTGHKGNDLTLQPFHSIYPPNFTGKIILSSDKQYNATRTGGKLSFSFK